MQSNAQQGGHFHTQLTGFMSKIIQAVNDFVTRRTVEKSSLMSKITTQGYGAQPSIPQTSGTNYPYPTGTQPQTYPTSQPSYPGAGSGYPSTGSGYPSTYPSGPQNYPAQRYPAPTYPTTAQGYPTYPPQRG